MQSDSQPCRKISSDSGAVASPFGCAVPRVGQGRFLLSARSWQYLMINYLLIPRHWVSYALILLSLFGVTKGTENSVGNEKKPAPDSVVATRLLRTALDRWNSASTRNLEYLIPRESFNGFQKIREAYEITHSQRRFLEISSYAKNQKLIQKTKRLINEFGRFWIYDDLKLAIHEPEQPLRITARQSETKSATHKDRQWMFGPIQYDCRTLTVEEVQHPQTGLPALQIVQQVENLAGINPDSDEPTKYDKASAIRYLIDKSSGNVAGYTVYESNGKIIDSRNYTFVKLDESIDDSLFTMNAGTSFSFPATLAEFTLVATDAERRTARINKPKKTKK